MRSEEIEIRTGDDETVRDITRECERFLADAGAEDGLLHVFVPHATAGLAVIETGAGSDATCSASSASSSPPTTAGATATAPPATAATTCSPR